MNSIYSFSIEKIVQIVKPKQGDKLVKFVEEGNIIMKMKIIMRMITIMRTITIMIIIETEKVQVHIVERAEVQII